MNERLKAVRTKAGMTQAEFAETLGTSRTAYAKYENGLVIPSDTFISLLCSKFHVSEHWLRTGEGEMKSESDEDMLSRIAGEMNLTPLQTEAFKILMGLPEEDREVVAKAFFAILKSITKRPASPPESPSEVKRKIVNAELDAEAKGKTS